MYKCIRKRVQAEVVTNSFRFKPSRVVLASEVWFQLEPDSDGLTFSAFMSFNHKDLIKNLELTQIEQLSNLKSCLSFLHQLHVKLLQFRAEQSRVVNLE